MNISDIISKETICLHLQAGSKREAIEQMSAMFTQSGHVTEPALFVSDVFVREATGSTGIGFGVAIPHGKSAAVSKPGLAFAKFAQPVEWNSLDNKPVTMAFLIGVPQQQAGQEHLKILTLISRKLVHESFREQLQNAGSAEDILQLLQF
ncbi:PTS sugar transporter subunit IIA [Ferviditalea candida]|uniref:Fructose PTS transporter subunit IIA n=1 Tax=Ferviditalea candida TaxID=3108399 RepID=A0ABU5ZGV1_9BACL|nr:fructose PTS transporter subunit IIA [Paenibacillaceae bacterium T2]